MLRILVLTRYDQLGASSRVRFLQFLAPLSAHEMSFTVQPFLDNEYVRRLYGGERPKVGNIVASYVRRFWTLCRAKRFDLIWMEKEALPWLPAAFELFLMRRMPYVVDLDDAWFLRYQKNPSTIIRCLMAGKIDTVMRRAVAVVVGNEYLARRARHAGAKQVEIIPSVIDLNRYPRSLPATMNYYGLMKNYALKSPVVIGWIGTPITARYLLGVERAFRAIAATRAVELHVVGAAAPEVFAGLPVKSIAWDKSSEIDIIRAFDIGIMPLDNTEWERGKCAYKLLQVMAAERPVVASPVGANCTVVQDGVNGFLADTTDKWQQELTVLIDDPDLRKRIGAESLRTIENRYTITRVLPQLAAVLTAASASGHQRQIKLIDDRRYEADG